MEDIKTKGKRNEKEKKEAERTPRKETTAFLHFSSLLSQGGERWKESNAFLITGGLKNIKNENGRWGIRKGGVGERGIRGRGE